LKEARNIFFSEKEPSSKNAVLGFGGKRKSEWGRKGVPRFPGALPNSKGHRREDARRRLSGSGSDLRRKKAGDGEFGNKTTDWGELFYHFGGLFLKKI